MIITMLKSLSYLKSVQTYDVRYGTESVSLWLIIIEGKYRTELILLIRDLH